MPPHLPERTRAAVSILLGHGYYPRTVSKELGISLHAVRDWADGNRPLQDRPRTGRPRVFFGPKLESLRQKVIDKRRCSTRLIAKQFLTSAGKPPHQTTVLRALRRDGAHAYHRMIRPFLSESQVAKRLAWCVQNADTDWSNYVYIDETSFARQKTINKHNDTVWAYSSKDVPIFSTMKSPEFQKCLLLLGPKRVFRHLYAASKLDSATFTEMIKASRIATAPKQYVQSSRLEDIVLLFDGDSSHKGVFIEWARSAGLRWVCLPPHSPDLNPAENLISYLNMRIDSGLTSSKS